MANLVVVLEVKLVAVAMKETGEVVEDTSSSERFMASVVSSLSNCFPFYN